MLDINNPVIIHKTKSLLDIEFENAKKLNELVKLNIRKFIKQDKKNKNFIILNNVLCCVN